MTKIRKWSNEEIDILKENYKKKTHKEIGLILNRKESAVLAKCHSLKLNKKEKEWTQEEIDILKKYYLIRTQSEIAKMIGRTKSAINIKASKLGLKKRYEYDKHFFQNINTEEKAYWLGFIWADGCIEKNNNSGELSIELQIQDKQHLKNFNKCLHGNLKVSERTRTNCFSGKYKNNYYTTCFIRVHSIDIVNDLISLGCTPNKSYTIGLPHLSNDLMWHFVRGFFDGDGCVCFQDNKTNLRCDFTSVSESLVINLRKWLYEQNICTYITKDGNKFRLCIAGREHNFLFLSKMYDNAKIYLDRKYRKQYQIRTFLNQIK